MGAGFYNKKIYVRCSNCKQDFNEKKVEFVNIEEDMQGRDILTFVCPVCKTDQRSLRRG